MRLTLLPLEGDGLVRVRCEGPVTLRYLPENSDPLRDLLGPLCFTHKVLLGLERAQSIDTSGACWLVRDGERFVRCGGRLVLHGVPPAVRRLLDVMRLTPLLPAARTEAEARQLLAAGPPGLPGPTRDLETAGTDEPRISPIDPGLPPRAG